MIRVFFPPAILCRLRASESSLRSWSHKFGLHWSAHALRTLPRSVVATQSPHSLSWLPCSILRWQVNMFVHESDSLPTSDAHNTYFVSTLAPHLPRPSKCIEADDHRSTEHHASMHYLVYDATLVVFELQ